MLKGVTLASLLLSTAALAAIDPTELQQIKAVQFNSDRVITSGLPEQSQFSLLRAAGVDLVINLIPDGNPNGHANEGELVAASGMTYAHIGVDWQQPSLADVESFLAIMDTNGDKDILIHCAANYRASAFYYLYLLHSGEADTAELRQQAMKPWGDLDASFTQYPQWQKLIEEVRKGL